MLAGGRMAAVFTYNMEEFINSCITHYSELSGNQRVRDNPLLASFPNRTRSLRPGLLMRRG
eukprot:4684340-Alexandrium_andersonii.AAC.1